MKTNALKVESGGIILFLKKSLTNNFKILTILLGLNKCLHRG
jgi:hypothetical protein